MFLRLVLSSVISVSVYKQTSADDVTVAVKDKLTQNRQLW